MYVQYNILFTSSASFRFLFSPVFLSLPCWKSNTFLPKIMKGIPVEWIFPPLISRGSSQSILWLLFEWSVVKLQWKTDLVEQGREWSKLARRNAFKYIYMYTSVCETFASLEAKKLRHRSCVKLRNEFIRLINRIYVSKIISISTIRQRFAL